MKYSNFILILFTLATLCYNQELTNDQLNKIKEITESVNKAPNFSLKSVSDSLYVLDEMKGKVVLLNFWAIFCGPCRMEIPDFNELYEKYHDNGFEILGINLSDTKQQLAEFSNVYNVKYPLLYGTFKEIDAITRSYGGVPAVPWSFLIGVEGDIIKTYPGAIIAQWDPVTYQNLIYTIENELKIQDNPQNLE